MRYFFTVLMGVFFFMGLIETSSLHATHNRGGEITIEQIGDLTVRATITTYTKASSVAADRDSLTIDWGDGNTSVIYRSNGGGFGEIIGNDLKVNIYIGEHTYPGRSTYTISMTDPNRIAGIQNINFPNSDLILFYIETEFSFLNPQFQGFNNSVKLLNPPIDFACVGERFVHNPNAYDPDGDSLSFHLIESLEASGTPVPRYEFPDEIIPGPDNTISMDPVTGDFVWDAPQLRGEYNIAIKIHEYRNGNIISTTIRDMQINVRDNCETQPPQIFAVDELCVIAGDTISETIIAEDPDIGQQVKLSAAGGPFELDISPARFDGPEGYTDPPVESQFTWETHCNHIREQFYQVIFKAEDNAFGNAGLVDLKNLLITVVGPAPENLEASSRVDGIELRWDKPYACEETIDEYFNGFTIWRRDTPREVEIDSCGTDLEAEGYSVIAFGQKDSMDGSYFFVDETVQKAANYCYRVTAEFARRGGQGNNPFNRVQSLPSGEVCAQLALDIPLITEVSVQETGTNDGAISLTWTRPLTTDFDTLEFVGPYTYQLWRSEGVGTENFQEIPEARFSTLTFAAMTDTTFTDSGLNTVATGYTYRVTFYTGENEVKYGQSPDASSVFLFSQSANRTNTLFWDVEVPWSNYAFDLFLLDDEGVIADSLGQVEEAPFVHRELVNEEEYCYLLKSTGSYFLDQIPDPLINFSQKICAIPLDTIPPCPPLLSIKNICTHPDEFSTQDPDNLVNILQWVVDECDFFEDDIAEFLIYYSQSENEEGELIAQLPAHQREFSHSPEFGLTGCYSLQAIDLAGNISEMSNRVCKSNCPVYNLPNAFTPNGDGFNDLFIPYRPYLFVERVDFQIYNRWGQKVFETSDPEINWDGTNFSGTELAEGTYHYRARVFFIDLSGEESYLFKRGFIQLIRE